MSRFGESSLNLDAVLDDKRAEIIGHVDAGMRDQAADMLEWAGGKLSEVASRCPELYEHLGTVIGETIEEHWAEIVCAAGAEAKRSGIYEDERDPDAYIEFLGRLLIGAQQELVRKRDMGLFAWAGRPAMAEVVPQ
jgi:hypothetical protein